MTWNAQRTKDRIASHIASTPTFQPGTTLAGFAATARDEQRRGVFDLLSSKIAFPVEGVHLYGLLLDFDNLVSEEGLETEKSHQQVLQFLHTYYRVWDAIVARDDAHRVDYHGARMHAVLTGSDSPAEQIERSVALASKLSAAARRIGEAQGFPSRIRFGIDYGRCVAMTTGRLHDRDTLFLGTPANHAAKKVAESSEPGIFLAEGAIRGLGYEVLERLPSAKLVLKESFVRDASRRHTFGAADQAIDTLLQEARRGGAKPEFSFYRPVPPLVDTKFRDLTPAHSARAGMACLFADIDGFTAYVDAAMQQGESAIHAAVQTIHVIREELNAVLQSDSGGKRVRFIGDCIEGCLVAGNSKDDPRSAVVDAAFCAAAMRTSFDFCLEAVQPNANIDLAVGIEYGPTPLTRIGTRGDHSVRCAAGRALVAAERLQQSINGGGVKLGENALAAAPAAVQKHFGESRKILDYAAAADLLAASISPIVSVVKARPEARPHSI